MDEDGLAMAVTPDPNGFLASQAGSLDNSGHCNAGELLLIAGGHGPSSANLSINKCKMF